MSLPRSGYASPSHQPSTRSPRLPRKQRSSGHKVNDGERISPIALLEGSGYPSSSSASSSPSHRRTANSAAQFSSHQYMVRQDSGGHDIGHEGNHGRGYLNSSHLATGGGLESPHHHGAPRQQSQQSQLTGDWFGSLDRDFRSACRDVQMSPSPIGVAGGMGPGSSATLGSPSHHPRVPSGSGSNNRFGSLDRSAAMRQYGYREPRDRSVERILGTGHGGHVPLATATLDSRHRSSGRYQSPASPSSLRNRSLDRDGSLVESRFDSEDGFLGSSSSAAFVDSGDSLSSTNQSLMILRLQTELIELTKEQAISQRALEQNKSQLNSYMASVKTFWSPELKKERGLRKEEAAKTSRISAQYKQLQTSQQISLVKLQAAEDRLRLQGIRNESGLASHSLSPSTTSPLNSTSCEHLNGGGEAEAAARRERHERELSLLQRTIEEMELRIDIQKKTLGARDASVRKLVEMLQSKGVSLEGALELEGEKDKLVVEVAGLERRLKGGDARERDLRVRAEKAEKGLETSLRDLKEARSDATRANRQSRNFDDLQGTLDLKNARISQLEGELCNLEKEVNKIRESSEHDSEEKKHFDALKSHELVLKSKIENMKVELSTKSSELFALNRMIEDLEGETTSSGERADRAEERLNSLREEYVAVCEQKDRLEGEVSESESRLRQEVARSEGLTVEGQRLMELLKDAELSLREHETTIETQNKKLESLEEICEERSTELGQLQTRLSEQHTADSTVANLEKVVAEKKAAVEKLKALLLEDSEESTRTWSALRQAQAELEEKAETERSQLAEVQDQLLCAHDFVSELKAEKLKQERTIHQLEEEGAQRETEKEQLRADIAQLNDTHVALKETVEETESKIAALQSEVDHYSSQNSSSQKEIDRLLEIMRSIETDGNDKDRKIWNLQDEVKGLKHKRSFRRRQQQTDKGKAGSESRPADDSNSLKEESSDEQIPTVNLEEQVKEKEERVEELEEALRQSVKITAEREMVVETQRRQMGKMDKHLSQLKTEVSVLKAYDVKQQVGELEVALKEKEEQLRKLSGERNKHMEEAFEMKQEAILAAISEKDSHIAMLEDSSKSKTAKDEVDKLNFEKSKLNQRLKELTTQRMMLVVQQSSDNARKLANSM